MPRRTAAALLSLAACLGLGAVAVPANAATAAVKVRTGVSYTVDGAPQLLDIYSPAKAGAKQRAIIFIHGGAWVGGSRAEWAQRASAAAAAGWVAFTIDYRLNSSTP